MVPRNSLQTWKTPGSAAVFFLLIGALSLLRAAEVGAVSSEQGAALLKTQVMGVFAHPDDETGMAATLASYALGRTSVVANVYCTRGEGGGNMVGTQWGAALGHLREAELRDCLNTLGVRYCYFLDRLDWAYTESAAATLRAWNKEETLEKLVRLVRALRPEVIVTMNPAPSPGQHGHHQAAGLLATEAFSAAANPERFPLQLSREGLSVWQPRKLYYGGGSTGRLAVIDVTVPLPSGQTPAQVAGKALSHHRSQAFGNLANAPWLQRPQKFTLVKSFAPEPSTSEVDADLLSGLPTPNLVARAFPSLPRENIRLEFVNRPAVENYQEWAVAQGVEHVAVQFNADLPVVAGEENQVALRVLNLSGAPLEGTIQFEAPDGWILRESKTELRLGAGAHSSPTMIIRPPVHVTHDVDVKADLIVGQKHVVTTARLHPVPKTTVPRVTSAPALDGSETGWGSIPEHHVDPTRLWQGKVRDEADSSAVFRLAHDGTSLFVDVVVKDDVVVSNIAPNDIRGHWRSDAIEICIDPIGGAEDTMGCFKLGIFPFDSTGQVRAARDADARQGLAEETAPRTRLASRRLSDGYAVRVAIPFDELGVKPAGRQRLGFNLLVYDGDKADAAPGENINKSRLAWSPRPGVMGRPEDWGRIDLE